MNFSPDNRLAWRVRERRRGGWWRWGGFMLLSVIALAVAGCASGPSNMGGGVERQIRERIESIREAILAKDAEGITHWGTDDWSFAPADGTVYDRAAYRKRVDALFARIVEIESLETVVDHVTVRDQVAEVAITQTMIRRERPAEHPVDGPVVRVWLRYREQQMWVRQPAGDWRVRRVEFMGAPERRELAK